MTSQDVKMPIITLSAGPVDAYPAVLSALGRTVTYDFDPYFQGVFEQTALSEHTAGEEAVAIAAHSSMSSSQFSPM